MNTTSYLQGYACGSTECTRDTKSTLYWQTHDYARVRSYGTFLMSFIGETIVPSEWSAGFLAGWKDLSVAAQERVRSTHETESFRLGVIAGYHLYGESANSPWDRVSFYDDNHQENLIQYIYEHIAKMTEPVVPSDWADGVLAGWSVRKAQEEREKNQ